MNAVISGQVGVAILVEGLKLASIHAGGDGEVIGRRPEEVRFLLSDAHDLEFVKDIGRDEATHRLEVATSKYDALHLALILLDRELSDDTRQTAAEELEELLGGDPAVADFPTRVLFSHPFPPGADSDGALACCTVRTPLAKRLIKNLIALQPLITEVYHAWERIPLEVFGTKQDRTHALAAAVKAGLFRHFVLTLASQRSVDDFCMQAFRNPSFEVHRNRREILSEWTSPLRLPIREIAWEAEWMERTGSQAVEERPKKRA